MQRQRTRNWVESAKAYAVLTVKNILSAAIKLVSSVFGLCLMVFLLCLAVLVFHALGDFLRAPIGIKDTPKEGLAALADEFYFLALIASLLCGGLWWLLFVLQERVDAVERKITRH